MAEIGVHEADRDAIGVEERSSEGDTLEDQPKILDTATLFFELHGTGVICAMSVYVESNDIDISFIPI